MRIVMTFLVLALFAGVASADEQQKMLDELATKKSFWTDSILWYVIGYGVVGLIVLGHWSNANGFQRFVSFVVFPVHVLVMLLLGGTVGGVKGLGGNDDVKMIGGFILKLIAWIAFLAFFVWMAAS